MKNNTLLLIVLFITTFCFAQTKFTNGFNTGYKKGYCQDQGIGCIAPIPPISPTPKIGESSDSYTDGYNRGFNTGLNARKSNSNERTRYKTAKPKFVEDVMYNSQTNSKAEAIKALDRKQDFNLAYAKILKSKIRLIKKENPQDQQLIEICNGLIEKIEIVEEPKYVLVAQDVLTKINKNINVIETELKNENKVSGNINNDLLNEAQDLYQKKEFNQLIEKLKPIEEKITQGAITDKKTLFFTYSILAYSHYNKNNLAKTIKYTTKAIENSLTDEIGDLYFLRGLSKSNIGDYYGSNTDYDYLIKNHKKINYKSNTLSTLYNNKAYNFVLLKNYSEAKPFIEKALKLDDDINYIWDTKGELEYHLGNYSDAVNAMSKSIKIKPTANSYYFRGLAEIKLGNKEKGCSDLSKAGEMGETKAYTKIKNKCN